MTALRQFPMGLNRRAVAMAGIVAGLGLPLIIGTAAWLTGRPVATHDPEYVGSVALISAGAAIYAMIALWRKHAPDAKRAGQIEIDDDGIRHVRAHGGLEFACRWSRLEQVRGAAGCSTLQIFDDHDHCWNLEGGTWFGPMIVVRNFGQLRLELGERIELTAPDLHAEKVLGKAAFGYGAALSSACVLHRGFGELALRQGLVSSWSVLPWLWLAGVGCCLVGAWQWKTGGRAFVPKAGVKAPSWRGLAVLSAIIWLCLMALSIAQQLF